MTASNNDPPAEQREAGNSDLAEPVSAATRTMLVVLGLGGMGAGSYAVFVSENQAGTALLLVLGAVFLLIGAQGTPIRRFGHGDSSVELANIRRRLADVADHAVREESPDVAAAVVDAVSTVDPIVGDSRLGWLAYERAVLTAIRRVGASIDPTHPSGPDDKGVDCRASFGSGMVNVQVKFRGRGPVSARDVRYVAEKAKISGFGGGFLLVTNAPLSADVLQHNASLSPANAGIEAITWNDERDDEILARALARNAR